MLIMMVMVMIMLILLVFEICANYIGYRIFTKGYTEQYGDTVIRVAKESSRWMCEEDLEMVLSSEGKGQEYELLREDLTDFCNSMGANYIYAIIPDRDYMHIRFIMSTVSDDMDSNPYDFGYVTDTTNDKYKNSYRAIFEEGSESELVVRDNGLQPGRQPHITALVPIHDTAGNVAAIMAAEMNMEYLNEARAEYLRNIAIAAIVLFLLANLIYGYFMYHNIVSPIIRIERETERFTREKSMGNPPLGEQVKTRCEIRTLALTVDEMERQTLEYFDSMNAATAENERINTELDIAAGIQEAIIPRDFPAFPERDEFEIYASMSPAKLVGGDFYDFILLDDDHIFITMADVSGKSITAALFMMMAKSLLSHTARFQGGTPAEILSFVNERLCENNVTNMFVTVWAGILEISTGKLLMANAGHEYPALRQKGGRFELFKAKHGIVLGAVRGAVYMDHEIIMGPGDSLYVYTDGVVEANNESYELFGCDRMLRALNIDADADPEKLLENVRKEVDDFAGDASQFDDITMLSLKYNGRI